MEMKSTYYLQIAQEDQIGQHLQHRQLHLRLPEGQRLLRLEEQQRPQRGAGDDAEADREQVQTPLLLRLPARHQGRYSVTSVFTRLKRLG